MRGGFGNAWRTWVRNSERSHSKFSPRSLRVLVGLGASSTIAIVCGLSALTSTSHTSKTYLMQSAEKSDKPEKSEKKSLPTYTRAEVAAHRDKATGVWVTFQGKVYDITRLLEGHPGGQHKLMLAAGSSLEPFWYADSVHNKDYVRDLLRQYLIGELAVGEAVVNKAIDDPYRNDPERHLALVVQSAKPFCAEVPRDMLANFVTPNDLWFVRSHHPVPATGDSNAYKLEVKVRDDAPPVTLTLKDLEKLPKHSVVVTLQCAGNRRSEYNKYEKTIGNTFQAGAISNAKFTGVRLRDVLKHCGFDVNEETRDRSLKHVQFTGSDKPYSASIPINKALALHGDVLVAYQMNDQPLPADHGFPVRAVVPGHLGARSVKWLDSITVSKDEAPGIWQQGVPYKTLPPNVKTFDGVDVSGIPASQELPVQSAIIEPPNDADFPTDSPTIDLKGYAYSGGGRGVVRVDLTADGGKTWFNAKLTQGPSKEDIEQNRAWTWSHWEGSVPVKPEFVQNQRLTVCSKATDSALNTQPSSPQLIWNLRGVYNNAWSCISVRLTDD